MAIFKPPQGTSAERSAALLEKGELMFDTTNNVFYTGNDTPGGKPITETTIAIASTETVASNSNASFEETTGSTPQARVYKFKYPRPESALSVPVIPLADESVSTPDTGKVTPFLRTNGEGKIEFAVKKQDASVEVVSAGGNSSGIQLAICTAVDATAGQCTARPIAIAADGTTSWSGEAVTGLHYSWSIPTETV